MRLPAAALALAISASCLGEAPAAPQPGGKKLILNEDGYFRQYYQFGLMRISPAALKTEGEKLLGAKGLVRLERQTRQHLRDSKIDWAKTDWRDHAAMHFRRTQLGDDSRAVEMIRTVPPPADWGSPAFDDSSWLRQRVGRLPGHRYAEEAYEFSWHLIRVIHLRSYFQVDDPASVKALTLRLTCRGGARVLVNGQEVGRGNLPPGELTGDSAADDYPRQAYVSLPGEGPGGGGGGIFADIRCRFDQATRGEQRRREWKGFALNASEQPINRAGWQRLTGLRDRRLDGVTIPSRLLRKGANVLAVEIRAARFHPQILPGAGGPRAANWGVHGGTTNLTWDHARLLSLELTCDAGDVRSSIARPPGVQVWADDMHRRLFDRDFNPPGAPRGEVRIVGACNGTFSGMAVVGTDRPLTGLTAAVGELAAPDGSVIPASAVRVSYLKGRSILELSNLGSGRCLGYYQWNCPMAVVAVSRYQVRPPEIPKEGQARELAWNKALSAFSFFDQVTGAAPAAVQAESCQPIWLSLKVPPDAKRGTYRGVLTVRAKGMAPVAVPVKAEVLGWRVPGPAAFQTIVESEQSPYGVFRALSAQASRRAQGAGRRQAPGKPPAKPPAPPRLWSQEHWRLMETSFRQLARLGADWIFVPVLLNSEFGNRDDCSMIRWIRARDGKLRFDYTILDRYLDLAVKHWKVPRVVCFQIMHGCPSATYAVKVLDEVSGNDEVVDVGPKAVGTRRPLWRAFATSLRDHMIRRGMEKSMYWGHAFDAVVDPGLIRLMEEFTPGIHWAAGAHGRKPDSTFRAVARAYGSDITDRSMKGWKNPFVHLVMPRSNGSTICVEGTSTPFTYRVLPDRAIYCGFNGVGRMGADYYHRAWFDGFRGGQYLLVGRSCTQTLWPEPGGSESSARNEAMLEGIQEAEARIFMEQALDRSTALTAGPKALPDDLAAEARQVLDDHFRETLHIPGGTAAYTMMEYTGDWQGRSRRLFAAAAKVARAVGVDVDRTAIGAEKVTTVFYGQTRTAHGRRGVPLAALGKTRVSLKLRNWTATPRVWKAATTQPWIRPDRTGGRLAGIEELGITLSGKDLKPDQTVAGTLTVTDVESGRNWPVRITAQVLAPFDFKVQKPVFNVTVGGSEWRDFLLVNRTDAEQDWKIDSTDAWLRVEPASGVLAPRASVFVKVTAAPADEGSAFHASRLSLTAARGAVREEVAFKTFVIRLYRPPAGVPAGVPVPLAVVNKKLMVRHRTLNRFSGQVDRGITLAGVWDFWHGPKPLVIGRKTYKTGLWVLPYHETVYKLSGSGLDGFSAEVGWNALPAKSNHPGHTTFKVNFEVHVDGKVVAESGLMKSTDPPRLLVVRDLAKAKEMKLVTRTEFAGDDRLLVGYCNWGEPKFYRR